MNKEQAIKIIKENFHANKFDAERVADKITDAITQELFPVIAQAFAIVFIKAYAQSNIGFKETVDCFVKLYLEESN